MSELRDAVVEAIEAENLDAVWSLLEPRRGSLKTDPELALVWLRALERAPARATLIDEVRDALHEREDAALIVAGCAALNAAAQLRPLDVPPLSGGPAEEAARLAEQALARSADDPLAAYLWINRANALRALGPEHDDDAQSAYATALALDDRGWWHFDLAVLHKWRGRWQPCLDASLKARARVGEKRPIQWNIALAATALGDGDLAGGVWRDLGLEPRLSSKSGLAEVDGIPPLRVRVPARPSGYGLGEPEGDQLEVVWVQPISPCHGVVASPTFGDAPVDYGDLVLWDGAPVALDPPCFPLLEILRRGDERRLRFVGIVKEGEVEALVASLEDLGVRAFAHPRGQEVEGERLIVGKLIVPASVDLDGVRGRVEATLARARNLRLAIPELYELCGDTKRAGREHQAWRGVAKAAIKRGLVES